MSDEILTDEEIELGVVAYEQAMGKYFLPTQVPEQHAFFSGMAFMKHLIATKNQQESRQIDLLGGGASNDGDSPPVD